MTIEQSTTPIDNFNFEGNKIPVSFIETVQVANGVECDVYVFNDNKTKDLGIIRIEPGNKTPLQKVLKGSRTIEGYISGRGKLTITEIDGQQKIYMVNDALITPVTVNIEIGELMQWEADPDSNLNVYELGFPPYEDGRYENIK